MRYRDDEEESGSFEDAKTAIKEIWPTAKKYVWLTCAAPVVLVLLWSTWFYCSPDENAVIQRFGRHVRTVGPGPHGKLPWPIEDYTTVSVTKIQRLELGYRTIEQGPPAKYETKPDEAEMLTGDLNIVEAEWIKQYRTGDAAKWLFSVKDPEEALRFVSQSSMRQLVAGVSFDQVATTDRAIVQDGEKNISQTLADRISLGVQFTATQLQDVLPPNAVRDAFRDVTNAKEEEQKKVQEAQGYANTILPRARGNAAQVVQDSLGYKDQRIAWAKGDTARFLDVLEKYRQAPDVTMQRMRYETIETVLRGKSQLVDRSATSPLKLYDVKK